MTPLNGTRGLAPQLSTAVSGNQDMYTSGACVSGLGAFYPGARLVYALTLGTSAPMGGTLTVTTCGHTAANTVLYVGTGCPTWALPFGCRVGNDNAAAPECGSNPLASTVSVVVSQPTYYIQVGGMSGAAVVSGLAWSYSPPSRSATTTRSRSRSSSGSRSRSRKPK